MAPKNVDRMAKKDVNRGAWTAEEDRKLSQCIAIHGDRRWKSVPAKAGLNRCGKSCRLRWLNYLRPNIKRGNISDQEEDLIIRLHKLLGNRWSLIAGRLPGRTDNEIKNYWNSHLSKKLNNEKSKVGPTPSSPSALVSQGEVTEVGSTKAGGGGRGDLMDEFNVEDFNVEDFFDFSQDVGPTLGPHEDRTVEMFDDHMVVVPKGGGLNLEWVREFLDIDDLEGEANSRNVPSLS